MLKQEDENVETGWMAIEYTGGLKEIKNYAFECDNKLGLHSQCFFLSSSDVILLALILWVYIMYSKKCKIHFGDMKVIICNFRK